MSDDTLKPHWFQLLLALSAGPLHGTAMMEEVLERTEGEMKLWPGTLYGSLRELAARGWIREVEPPDDAPTEGGKRRFYELTAEGRGILGAEVRRLAGWVEAARSRGVVEEGEPA